MFDALRRARRLRLREALTRAETLLGRVEEVERRLADQHADLVSLRNKYAAQHTRNTRNGDTAATPDYMAVDQAIREGRYR